MTHVPGGQWLFSFFDSPDGDAFPRKDCISGEVKSALTRSKTPSKILKVAAFRSAQQDKELQFEAQLQQM